VKKNAWPPSGKKFKREKKKVGGGEKKVVKKGKLQPGSEKSFKKREGVKERKFKRDWEKQQHY